MHTSLPFFLESCCQSADDARIAVTHGASRIELCENLAADGVTPSEANIRATLIAVPSTPVHILIRPREGSFVYNEDEVEQMERSVDLCRKLRVALPDGSERRVSGIVIGALTADGDLDVRTIQRLLAVARREYGSRLAVTFHRAFDHCRQPLHVFRQLQELGIERILTSGQATSAVEGAALLAQLVEAGGDGPRILVGGHVRPENIALIQTLTHASEYHSSFLGAWN